MDAAATRAQQRKDAIQDILWAADAHMPPAVALGLPSSHLFSFQDARAAFLARAALVHPDKAPGETRAGEAFAALRRAWSAVEGALIDSDVGKAIPARPLASRVELSRRDHWWDEWDGEDEEAIPHPPIDQHAAWAAGLETAALAKEVRTLQAAVVAGPAAERAEAAQRLRAARTEYAERTGGGGRVEEEEGGFLRGGL